MIWRWSRWFPGATFAFTVASCLCLGLASAQIVDLTSSVEQDGRQAACPGEVVIFTCMVTDGSGLQWVVEPFIPQSGSDIISFLSSAMDGDMAVDDSGLFRAVIISVTQRDVFGDFTSELTVTASATLDGTVVQCTDTASNMMSKSLTLEAPPSPPQRPSYSVSQYQLNDFTVTVQWESPASDGGVDIDSYTLAGAGITVPLTVLSNEPLMDNLTLSYNEMHMVSITASNCAGESTASVVIIHEVDCGPPTPPLNGSLGDLTSSREGAVVTFQCSPELVPSQEMMSVCAADGSWTPDPSGLVCREPADCGDPSLPVNGFVMAYDSTLEGSQIVFQCSPGFVPSQQTMSVCAANGSWTPDPAGLLCRADCGIPIIVNGSVNYTTTVERSTATYQCDTGLIPVGVITIMCMEIGEWDPDSADAGCRLPADCGTPDVVNGSVNYTTTDEGSIATYQCDTGLIPVEGTTAMCMENGEWVPDPAGVGCRLPGQANCRIPVIVNGSVSYTTTVEGSTAIYQCDTGLIPVGVKAAMCMENGEWVPDPANAGCRLPDQDTTAGTPSESSIQIVVIAVAVAVAVVAVAVPVVIFIVIICIHWRKRKNSGAFDVKATAPESAPESTYDYARATTGVNLEMDSLPTNGFYDQPDTKKPPSEKLDNGTYDDPDSMKPPLPPSSSTGLIYADLGLAPTRVPPPAPPSDVQYSQIVPQSVPKSAPKSVSQSVPIDIDHPADKLLNLDTALAQLKEVQESWYGLGTGLGVPVTTLDEIKSQCPSSQDCLTETVDSWIRGHTGTPTWRIITAVLRQINFQSLAVSIDQVYVTGELPTPFDNRVPSSSLGNPSIGGFGTPEGPPPPIPTRMSSREEAVPPKPPHYRGGQESRPPPLPSSAPPRPARSNQRRTPERGDAPPRPPKPAPYHGGQ